MHARKKNKKPNKPPNPNPPQTLENVPKPKEVIEEKPKCEVKEEQILKPEIVSAVFEKPMSDATEIESESPKKPKRNKGKNNKQDKNDENIQEKCPQEVQTKPILTIKETIQEIVSEEQGVEEKKDLLEDISVVPSARKKKNKKKGQEKSNEETKIPDKAPEPTLNEPIIAPVENIDSEIQELFSPKPETPKQDAKRKKNKKKHRTDSERSDKSDNAISCTTAFQKLMGEDETPKQDQTDKKIECSQEVITNFPLEKSSVIEIKPIDKVEETTKIELKDNKESSNDESKSKKKNKKDKKQHKRELDEEQMPEVSQVTPAVLADVLPQDIHPEETKKDNKELMESPTDSKIEKEPSPKPKAKIAKPVEKKRKGKQDAQSIENLSNIEGTEIIKEDKAEAKLPQEEIPTLDIIESKVPDQISEPSNIPKHTDKINVPIESTMGKKRKKSPKPPKSRETQNVVADVVALPVTIQSEVILEPKTSAITDASSLTPATMYIIGSKPEEISPTIYETSHIEISKPKEELKTDDIVETKLHERPLTPVMKTDNEGFEIKINKKKKKIPKVPIHPEISSDSKELITPEDTKTEDNSEKSKEEKFGLRLDVSFSADVEIPSVKTDDSASSCEATPDVLFMRSSSQQFLDSNNNTVIQELISLEEIKINDPLLVPLIEGSGETPIRTPERVTPGIRIPEFEDLTLTEEKTDIKSKMMEVNQDMEDLRLSIERSLAEFTSLETCEHEAEKISEIQMELKKEKSPSKDTLRKEKSPFKDNLKKEKSPSIASFQKEKSPFKDNLKKEKSPSKDTLQREKSPFKDNLQKEKSPNKDTLAIEKSSTKNILVKEKSPSKDTFQKEKSPFKDTLKKEKALLKDNLKKEKSPSKDTFQKEKSPLRDNLKKEKSPSKDTLQREKSPFKDNLRKEKSPNKDTLAIEKSSNQNILVKDKSPSRDTFKKEKSPFKDTLNKGKIPSKDTETKVEDQTKVKESILTPNTKETIPIEARAKEPEKPNPPVEVISFELPPVCPARKDNKGKSKSKKKGKQETTQATTTASSDSTATQSKDNTKEVKKEKTEERSEQKSKSNQEKGKQQSANATENTEISKDIDADKQPLNREAMPDTTEQNEFGPIEDFADALTSSVDDVNKSFEMIAKSADDDNVEFQKKLAANKPEIKTEAAEDTDTNRIKGNEKVNPVSQPKNLLGQTDIPVRSNRIDYKKEKNKTPNARQARVKIKDSVEIETNKQSQESQTENIRDRKNSDKSVKESFSKVQNDNEEYVYKYSFRKVFLQSACHVCNKNLNQVRIPCGFCNLIFYCGAKHKDEDWPQHQALCFAVSTIAHMKDQKHIYADAQNATGQDYRLLRMQTIVSCEKVLKRRLVPWEQEVLLYPRICADVACREWRQAKLKDCDGCQQLSYCADHPDHLPNTHARWCKSYSLYQKLVSYQQTLGRLEPRLPTKVMGKCEMPAKMNEVLASMYEEKIDMNDIQYAALTQLATAPLTAAYCLQLCQKFSGHTNGIHKKHPFTIHVVGAELQFEADALNKWETFFLHLRPEVEELKVVLVSPMLNPGKLPLELLGRIKLCDNCHENKRRVVFKFEDNKNYSEYRTSESFINPDIICAFNPSIQRSSIYNSKDSWPSTINSILKLKQPFIITSYTLNELRKDIARIKKVAEIDFKLISEVGLNSFASVRPDRNFISDDEMPLLFKNYCVAVVLGC